MKTKRRWDHLESPIRRLDDWRCGQTIEETICEWRVASRTWEDFRWSTHERADESAYEIV